MSYAIIIALAILTVCFLIKIPIPLGIFIASLSYLIITGDDISMIASSVMGSMYGNSSIVAAPLFIFLANIMTSTKISEYMYTFVKALFGGRRGATAYMNLLASLIFAGMSGSALSDACGFGMMEVDDMRKDGYDGGFSCALTAASACLGPIFPPSIQMVIFATLSGASIGKLFMGGILPAILITFSLGAYIAYISKKRNYPHGPRFTPKELAKYTWKALPALLTPLILVVGIYSGIVTATESGVLASAYAIFAAAAIYKVFTLKDLVKAIKTTVVQGSVVMATLASVYALNLVIVKSGLGTSITQWVLGLTDNKYIFLLAVNLLFLITGMFIPGEIPTYIIIPLLIPIASQLGIDMIHFGVVVTINLVFGMLTPPYGMLAFVISGASGEPLANVFKELTPMAIILYIDLLLMILIPQIVTLIPSMMG
jgi:tripartite ATP-independent transporter DctM subunit